MVARRSPKGMDASRSALAVSRLPRAAHEPTPTAPARLLGIGASRHHQACWGSYTAAQLRHPSPEQKTDIRIIQVLLGHKKLDTTALYTRVAVSAIGQVTSPLDLLQKMPG